MESLSSGFSVVWAKAGIAILRYPDQKDIVGTLYPRDLHTPKSFGLGPLTNEIWGFFQILSNFRFFNSEAMNIVKIKYNMQNYTRKNNL